MSISFQLFLYTFAINQNSLLRKSDEDSCSTSLKQFLKTMHIFIQKLGIKDRYKIWSLKLIFFLMVNRNTASIITVV